jgi:flagellar hook-associated protein 2
MALSTNLISGLSSGFDWRSMIDQLMKVEHRPVDLVESQKKTYQDKLTFFQDINTRLLSFKTTAQTLSSNDAFNVFSTALSTTSSNYSASEFLTVTANSDAMPGSHTITMNANSSVAQARKISSKSFSSYDTALGLSGEMLLNGRALKIETTADLQDIMNQINNLNSGSNATVITASILTVSTANYRLVLTGDNTGENSFNIFDAGSDAQNLLSSGLGFTDGTTSVKNILSNGAQSEAFSSSTQSVASLLGISTAQTGTITLGTTAGFTVALNLADSLTDIAGDINTAAAAAGSNISASVISATEDGVTEYRLKITNTTGFLDANHVLETLGILAGGHGDIAETHLSDTTNTKTSLAGGGNMDATTQWGEIDTGSDSNNIANDDTITFSGLNHIGTAVSGSYTIDNKAVDSVQGLLTKIQDAFAAVDGGAYTVTASIANGKIKLTDNSFGDSLLSLNLTTNNEGGGTLNLGTLSAATEGYTMQLQEGRDANVIIDGTAVTSSTNIIDAAIAGVTLNLLNVEAGSTVTLQVNRDYDSIKASVQDLLDAYNDVILEINKQFAYDTENKSAGLLQGDATLASIKTDLSDIVGSAITGLPTTLNALPLIGIHSTIDYTEPLNNGKLIIDNTDFMAALQSNFQGLRRVFVAEGSTTDADVEFIAHGNETVAGNYSVNITQAATRANVTGTEILTNGIGATDIETLTITQSSKTAFIFLNGAAGQNGSSIDNMVNAVNSELDTQYTQSVIGNVKNTTDSAQTTAVTYATTWNNVFSNGVAAGLADGEMITFAGQRQNGAAVSGSYTITAADADTIQGLLSAIESAFGNEVSAGIDSYGYLSVTDQTAGNSSLSVSVTGPAGKSLDFGAITTSNLVGDARNTAGGNALVETDIWTDLDGQTLAGGEVIKYAGYKANGEAVEGGYTVNLADQLGVFLTQIETDFGGEVTAALQDGRLVLTQGGSNGTLGLNIFEPAAGGVDFGTLTGGTNGRYALSITASKDGSDRLVLTHDDYGSTAAFTLDQSGTDLGLGAVTAGLNVTGSINGEAATGSGQLLTGNAPAKGATVSVEGLAIKYTGTANGSRGTVKITMGAAELFERALHQMTNTIDGYLDFRMESITESVDALDDQMGEMEDRLNRRMEMLVNRFVNMETALSRIQNISNWLSGQITAANSGWM